jgi:regulator of sigma E protease
VERFSLGFGPVVWKRRRGDTEWAVSALPLGGYVRIAGMAPGDEIAPDDAAAYGNQPAWRRLLVIVAGPGMNYVAALVLGFVLALSIGFPRIVPGPVIGDRVEGGPAEAAGLRYGDRIAEVDGKPVSTWPELVAEVVRRPGKPMELLVERDGARLTLTATPRDDGGVGRLGVGQAAQLTRASGVAEAAALSVAATNERAVLVLAGLGQVASGRQKAELRGPLGIAQEMARSARAGAAPFLGMVWFISIVLALFNLLPIPALDGGRLVFLIYEIVTRRRVNEKVENFVHLVGFVALFGLILWVTVTGDLVRIFKR